MGASTDHVWRVDESSFKEVKRGFKRKILTGDDLMLCLWRIKEGQGPTPYAPHMENEQFGVILAGQLDFRLASEQRTLLRPGDVYWAPKGCPHGDSKFIGDPAHGETWILDIFAPPREDYRNG